MADTHKKILGNVQLDDGFGESITSTEIGLKRGLDVNVIGGEITIENATILVDIDAFSATPDSVLIVGTEDGTITGVKHVVRVDSDGSVDTINTNGAGAAAVNIQDGGNSITVDALDLDIRDLNSATDSVTVLATDLDIRDLDSTTDSVEVFQANHDNLNANVNIQVGNTDVDNTNPVPVSDAGGSLTVDAINLDIRDLSATQDNVAISDGVDTLAINADGSINITDNGGSLTVDGTVTVLQGTSPWVVSGTVVATPSGTQDVNVVSSVEIEISNDVGNPIPVSAIDLDIRDLSHTQDSVRVGDGTDFIAVNADGSINITDNGGSLTVDGTVAATQSGAWSVNVNNGAGAAAVNIQDGGNSITVDAVDLDIRDLSHTQDSVRVGDGTDFIAVNADGSINITDNGGSLTVDGTISASNFPTTVDTNYGVVGANTIRTAAQIGNATGAADFNVGATTAQTLRVEANQGEPNAVADAWPIKITDGVDTVNVTASGELNVLATAQPGVDIGDVTVNNGPGAAAVNIQDGGNSITVDGTVSASNFPTTVDTNYGTVGANTIRTASQIGNATGAADFNVGATTAQTLRVEANQGEANPVAGAWPVLLTDGVDTVAVNTNGSINISAAPGTLTDRSGTATSVSTQMMAANADRKYLFISNPTTNIMWFNFTTAAVNAPPSIRLAAGETFVMESTFISTEAIFSIRNASLNVPFTAKEG